MIEKIDPLAKIKLLDNNDYSLFNNYPNPFNPTTKFTFTLAQPEKASLIIYNILGQEIVNVVNELLDEGSHTYNFNAVSLPSGIYFYRLTAGKFTAVKKMQLLK
jgi:hypothetical protein